MSAPVWKFGYGSNIQPEFLRTKKNLTVLDYRRCILKGFALSFPLGRGIDFVEPSFATLRKEQGAETHGTCVLFPPKDAASLDAQEGAYDIETHECVIYDGDEPVEGKQTVMAEVYAPRRLEPEGNPQGTPSERYRDILLNGAKAMELAPYWIEKLQNLKTYTPTAETLAIRAKLPIFEPLADLPSMTIAELAQHNGSDASKPILTSACGYIFKDAPSFKIYNGRDTTFRLMLQARGISMDLNDDGGKSPFPKLAEVSKNEGKVLDYVLNHRDRCQIKGGQPVAILKEFWDDQK